MTIERNEDLITENNIWGKFSPQLYSYFVTFPTEKLQKRISNCSKPRNSGYEAIVEIIIRKILAARSGEILSK